MVAGANFNRSNALTTFLLSAVVLQQVFQEQVLAKADVGPSGDESVIEFDQCNVLIPRYATCMPRTPPRLLISAIPPSPGMQLARRGSPSAAARHLHTQVSDLYCRPLTLCLRA